MAITHRLPVALPTLFAAGLVMVSCGKCCGCQGAAETSGSTIRSNPATTLITDLVAGALARQSQTVDDVVGMSRQGGRDC